MLLRFAMIGRVSQDFGLHADIITHGRTPRRRIRPNTALPVGGHRRPAERRQVHSVQCDHAASGGPLWAMSRASRGTAFTARRPIAGGRFELIDTGGIIPNDDEMIPTRDSEAGARGAGSAAQIIFLIDGRTEITGADRDLAKMLRKLGKPVSLAVNKIDSPKREGLAHEFHSLGFEHLFPVSAEHRIGLDDLLDHVTAGFPASRAQESPEERPRAAKKRRASRSRSSAGRTSANRPC